MAHSYRLLLSFALCCKLLLSTAVFAQSYRIDGLEEQLLSASEDELPILIHRINEELLRGQVPIDDCARIAAQNRAIALQKGADETVVRLAQLVAIRGSLWAAWKQGEEAPEAIASLEGHYGFFNDESFPLGIAECAEELAFYHKRKNQLDLSLKYALEASDIYEEYGYNSDAAYLYSQIAMEHYAVGNLSLSHYYLQKTLNSGTDQIPIRSAISAYNTLGLIYEQRGHYDSAIHLFTAAIRKAELFQDSVWLGLAMGNLGGVYLQMQKYDTALFYLKEDIEFSKTYNEWGSAVNALNDIGKIYQEQGDWEKARRYYLEAFELIEKYRENEVFTSKSRYITYNNLSHAYAHLNQSKLAYEFSQQALVWGDSMLKNNLTAAVDRIQQQHEWEKQTQIIKAHEAAQEREIEAQQSKTLSLFVIALSLGILFIAAILINRKQQQLNHTLKRRNDEIQEKNIQIESQNEELEQQQEEISMQNKAILETNNRLQKSNEALKEEEAFLKTLLSDLAQGSERIELENQQLNEEIKHRTKELIIKSEELARYTQQLEGFAYVTAHNIRGPIARLKGLANIFTKEELSPQNAQIWAMFEKNVEEVDEIIKDLGAMLDVRTNIHESFEEEVSVLEIMEKTEQMLQNPLSESKAVLHKDFQAPTAFTIRPYLENIFYQLLTNAIKFRAPNRRLEIWVSTEADTDNLILKVKDNGLGLDLEKYSDQLFQMYKRFHLHTKGKGLGLHLTKIQAENLHGKIELFSQPNQGMEVKITLPLDPGIVVH